MSPWVAVIIRCDGRPCFASGRPAPFKPPAGNGAPLELRFDAVAGGSCHGAGPATDVAGWGGRDGLIPWPHRTAAVSARCRVSRLDVPPDPLLGSGPAGFSEKKPAWPLAAAADSGDAFARHRPSISNVGDLFRVLRGCSPGVWYRIRTCYTCVYGTVLYPLS
jgi:hypothetical protein